MGEEPQSSRLCWKLTTQQRATQTLRQVTATPQPELLDSDLHPSKFQDGYVREAIEELSMTYKEPDVDPEDRTKRRKVSSQNHSAMSVLVNSIRESLGLSMEDDDNWANFEQQYL